MTWEKDQKVVVGSSYMGEHREHWRGTVEKLRPGGGCIACGRYWNANGVQAGVLHPSFSDPRLWLEAAWEAKVVEYKRLANEKAQRAAEAKRQTAAWDRITHALRNATAEQYEALADELEARAPTFVAGSPNSWNVQIDGNNMCFRPCSEPEARATYAHWRTQLAADYAADCDAAAEEGDPKPEPPTLALVVEVVVDRWQP